MVEHPAAHASATMEGNGVPGIDEVPTRHPALIPAPIQPPIGVPIPDAALFRLIGLGARGLAQRERGGAAPPGAGVVRGSYRHGEAEVDPAVGGVRPASGHDFAASE